MGRRRFQSGRFPLMHQHVLAGRKQPQVRYLNATTIPAKMVYVMIGWYWTIRQHIGEAVGKPYLALKAKLAVAMTGGGSPDQAVAFLLDFGPESVTGSAAHV